MKISLLMVCLVLFLSGCVEKIITEPKGEHHTRLAHVQAGDSMTMSWESRTGYIYRVYVKDENHYWHWEKRFPDMPGTGESMSITKKITPGTELPLYAVRGIKKSLLPKN